jgi:hypothetical protein
VPFKDGLISPPRLLSLVPNDFCLYYINIKKCLKVLVFLKKILSPFIPTTEDGWVFQYIYINILKQPKYKIFIIKIYSMQYKFISNEPEDLRERDEWNLENPNLSETGYRANALFNYLYLSRDIEVLSEEEKNEIERLKDKIEELEILKDEPNSDQTGIDDEIKILNNEIDSLKEGKYDVYDMVPDGHYYECEIFKIDDLDKRYAVGNDYDMHQSAKEYLLQYLDEVRDIKNAFRYIDVTDYLDVRTIRHILRDFYHDSFWDSPESYLDENQRSLSAEQEDVITIKEDLIVDTNKLIKKLEIILDKNFDRNLEQKISNLNDLIGRYEFQIEEIRKNPEGDFSDEAISEAFENYMDTYIDGNEVDHFIDMGFEIDGYIDKDALVEGVIEHDGYQVLSSYDGDVDEERIKGETYFIIRID